MAQLLTITCMLLVLSDKGKGMQSSSEQPLVGRIVTTLITAAKETKTVQPIVIQQCSILTVVYEDINAILLVLPFWRLQCFLCFCLLATQFREP